MSASARLTTVRLFLSPVRHVLENEKPCFISLYGLAAAFDGRKAHSETLESFALGQEVPVRQR